MSPPQQSAIFADQQSPATSPAEVVVPASATPSIRRTDFLAFSPPSIGEEEIAAVARVMRSDWITTGPETRRFEERFAAAVNAPAALALNSCTAGLHVALAAYGIGPGDEVITTTLTFAATSNVVELLGARPVLVDVEPDTLNIDPARVEAAVTPRTRAIMPVHFAGHPAEMDPLEELAAAHDLILVEDAAHALPARYRGRAIGSAKHPTAFSFYATKNLSTAEGGMLTGEPAMIARSRVISLHGMSADAASRYRQGGKWAYEVMAPGYKYNMTDIAAAMGIVQLGRLPDFQARRQAVARSYMDAFAGEEALELPAVRPHVQHAWHLFALRLRDGVLSIGRDRFIEELTARGIGTSVHFIPVHMHPYYRDRYGLAAGDYPVALDNFRRLVSLPLHPRLADGDVADVVEATYDVIRRFRR